MATYTTAEVRSRIAAEIQFHRRAMRGSTWKGGWVISINALRSLARLHFPKEQKAIHAVTNRISA